jgi:glycerol-3-phosphate acyltransferase PlsY
MVALYIIVALAAYLLGSIPFGYLLVRIFRGEDIRLSGSGNIGATNVARSGAKGLGIATLILDALKGMLGVFVAFILGCRAFFCCSDLACPPVMNLMSVAALFAVLGHIFPVWLGFKGGKGVATALGVFALLFPKGVLVCLVVFVIVVAVSRYVSLGSIVAATAFPVAVYLLGYTDWVPLLLVSATALAVIVKHHQNIGRLLAGNESRLGSKKNPATEKQALAALPSLEQAPGERRWRWSPAAAAGIR